MDTQMLLLGLPVTAGLVGRLAWSQPKIKCWLSDRLKLHQFFQKHPEFDFRKPARRQQQVPVPEGWTIGEYEHVSGSNFAAQLTAADCHIIAISKEEGAGGCFAHILIASEPRQKDEATSFYHIGKGKNAGYGATTTSSTGAQKRYQKLLHLTSLVNNEEALRSPEFKALQYACDENLRVKIEAFSISNDALLPQYRNGQFDDSPNCLMTSTPTIINAARVAIPARKIEAAKVFYIED